MTPRIAKERDVMRLENLINDMAITRRMGVTVRLQAPATARATIDAVHSFHGGGMEAPVANGAILLGMLDCVNVAAGMLVFPNFRCATVDIATQFIHPAGLHGLTVVGSCVGVDGRAARTRGEVRDGRGRVCAIATATVIRLAPRKCVTD